MAKKLDSLNKRNSSRNFIYLWLFIIVLITLFSYFYHRMSIDIVTDKVMKKANINFLIVISDNNKPIITQVGILNGGTHRLALLDIPSNSGGVLPSLNRSDEYGTLYEYKNIKKYEEIISDLVGIEFFFTLNINLQELSQFIDLIEGIPVEQDVAINKDNKNGEKELLPNGSLLLDGDKVITYLKANSLLSLNSQLNFNLIKQLLFKAGKITEKYNYQKKKFIRYLYKTSNTSLNFKGFTSLLNNLALMDLKENGVLNLEFIGRIRKVSNKDVLFPIYKGELIKERVHTAGKSLTHFEQEQIESSINLAILNGTSRPNLASRTAEIYKTYGYHILRIDNAQRQDYQKSVIINYMSNDKMAKQVASFINCKNIQNMPKKDSNSNVMIEVILGKDFDGRRVIN